MSLLRPVFPVRQFLIKHATNIFAGHNNFVRGHLLLGRMVWCQTQLSCWVLLVRIYEQQRVCQAEMLQLS